MRRTTLYLLFGLTCILLLASCKVGKRYVRPDLNLPERIDSLQPVDSFSIAEKRWWEVYADTTLQGLIEKALVYNKDMKAAAARVRELAATKHVDLANLFPSVSFLGYADKEAVNYGGHDYSNDPELGSKLAFSWEIDLWGNLRWARERSVAQFLASVEAQRALQMSIIAEVAQAYFELVALDNELSIVRQTLNAREEGVRLAKIRFEGGLTSETSYQQAEVEYARTATLVPDLERKISLKQNDIAFLVGEYPQHIERSVLPEETHIPGSLPAGLPSTLLERRPDIRQAEQQLKAAHAAVGVAYTNMFPKLNLTVHLGYESGYLSDLYHSPYHWLRDNLVFPIIAWGKYRAQLKAKKAAYEQECARYEKSVLNAFKEVHNAIVNYNKMKEIYESRLQLEHSSKTTMELAQLQYINGIINYMDVLDAQRLYFNAQIDVSNAVRDELLALVDMYKALGGGW
ncbi:MAG: efflux transporter outer membrane subunit [Prevotellaceae bacterium]|nr:efflux transporter outer membrane subunit [Prevotellaceae bacterium]